ncbi:hypothetical protein FACS1894216_14920 [Synergistales bacterium]|nr:hypothetical protein FACS1894216_14920 [Synergistales bacterium]
MTGVGGMSGAGGVTGAGDAEAMTMLNCFVTLPTLLVAFTVKLKVPAADGVPLIVPELFSAKPTGKVPSS